MAVRAVIDVELLALCAMHYVMLDPAWTYPSLMASIEQHAVMPIFCAEMQWDFEHMLTRANPLGKKYKIAPAHATELAALFFGEGYGIEVSLDGDQSWTDDDDCDDLIDVAIHGEADYIVSENPFLTGPAAARILASHKIVVVGPADLVGALTGLPY